MVYLYSTIKMMLAFETCWAKLKQVTSVGLSLFNYSSVTSGSTKWWKNIWLRTISFHKFFRYIELFNLLRFESHSVQLSGVNTSCHRSQDKTIWAVDYCPRTTFFVLLFHAVTFIILLNQVFILLYFIIMCSINSNQNMTSQDACFGHPLLYFLIIEKEILAVHGTCVQSFSWKQAVKQATINHLSGSTPC